MSQKNKESKQWECPKTLWKPTISPFNEPPLQCPFHFPITSHPQDSQEKHSSPYSGARLSPNKSWWFPVVDGSQSGHPNSLCPEHQSPPAEGFCMSKAGDAGQSLSGTGTVRGSNSGERGKGCVATSHGGHEANCGNPTTPTHKKITAASECSPYSRHSGLSTLSYLLLVTAHPEAPGHTPPANSWFSSFPMPRPAPCWRVRRKSWYVTFTLLSLPYIPVLSEERRTGQMKELCLPILTRNMTRT